MSDVAAFLQLGFHHIVDPAALDHLLFLLVLAAVYRAGEWRSAVWVVTAFTVGHSVTLALAVTGAMRLPTPLIEFLIPVTIVAAGLENLIARDRAAGDPSRHYRAWLAGIFGLVHGAGFANYLRDFFSGSIAVPLIGFNLGIELGQLLVLAAIALALRGVDLVLEHRTRVLAISAAAIVVAATMAAQRAPW